MSINKYVCTGNLTREPEMRYTNNNTPVLNFGIAVNDRRKNQQTGEWSDHPNFFDCKMFGARAESLGKFLHKGSKVALQGHLDYSTWEKDGQKRSKVEIIAEEIEFMSAKQDGAQTVQSAFPGAKVSEVYADDIPF